MPATATAPAKNSALAGLNKIQKLAALLVVLGPEEASVILRAFNHRQMEQIMAEMAKIEFLSADIQGALLEEYLAPISGVIGQPAFYQHQVAHYDARYTADFAERLPGMDLPVQILWGAEDEWQPLAYAHRLQNDIRGAVLQVVENAGHFLMEDAPERVSDYLLDFIARVHSQR